MKLTMGLLALRMGEILYADAIYKSPDGIETPIIVLEPVKDLRGFYHCMMKDPKDNQHYKIHKDLIGSIVVLFHDGTTKEIHQSVLIDSYSLYCSGHRAVWVENWFDKVKPIKIAYEITCSNADLHSNVRTPYLPGHEPWLSLDPDIWNE